MADDSIKKGRSLGQWAMYLGIAIPLKSLAG